MFISRHLTYILVNDSQMEERVARLVKRIALHLSVRLSATDQPEMPALVEAGGSELLRSARTWHPNRGGSFESYAGIAVPRALLDVVRRHVRKR